ncbi:MAG: hypothetical protein ACLFR1_13610 [Spirochaetia bacterium]
MDHIHGKVILYTLYLSDYPNLIIEKKLGKKYKPDVSSVDDEGRVLFWGESGVVSRKKQKELLKKYPNTHFAFLKHSIDTSIYEKELTKLLGKIKRNAPVDLIGRPTDLSRFISENGEVSITESDCRIIRF